MSVPALLLAVLAVAPLDGGLVLRAQQTPPPGEIVALTPEGVVVGSGASGGVIVGWDRVLEVRGDFADEWRAYSRDARDLWRACERLDRGDRAASEPIFERLFEASRGRRGPTAAAIAEGLLRCRLSRGAFTPSVPVWLAWLRATSPGQGPRGDTSAGARSAVVLALDPETGLLPQLPPIWLDLPSVRAFAGDVEDTSGDARHDQYAALYAAASAHATGLARETPPPRGGDAGVRLVWEVVAAQGPDAAQRRDATQALRARITKGGPVWEMAWARTAAARAMLRETGAEDRRRAVIELLRVRVDFADASPYLAGLALAEAAVELRRAGYGDGAETLRRELEDAFPGHPSLDWEPIAEWTPLPPGIAPAAPSSPESESLPDDGDEDD